MAPPHTPAKRKTKKKSTPVTPEADPADELNSQVRYKMNRKQ